MVPLCLCLFYVIIQGIIVPVLWNYARTKRQLECLPIVLSNIGFRYQNNANPKTIPRIM